MDPFPEAARYQAHLPKLRAYLKHRLVELASARELFLTEIFRHSALLVQDVAGQVILGHEYKPHERRYVAGVSVPPGLGLYTVRIEALPLPAGHGLDAMWLTDDGRRRIAYKDGMVSLDDIAFGESREYGEHALTGLTLNDSGVREAAEQNIVVLDSAEADLPLRSALLVLKQHGQWCRPCKRAKDRPLLWHYREVPPSELSAESPAPRKRRAAPADGQAEHAA